MTIGATELPAGPCQSAAARYRDEFGWSCGALDTEVWIRLAHGAGAVAVDQPLAGRLRTTLIAGGITGPVIDCPGRPGYWVFLVSGAGAPATRSALSAFGCSYRGGRRLIDLPPTQSGCGPLSWIDPPVPDTPFPLLDALLGALDHARARR